MLQSILETVGYWYGFYRASQDAGMWLVDRDVFGNYLEAYCLERGWL